MMRVPATSLKGHWTDLWQMAYGPCHALQDALLDQVAAGNAPSTLLFVEHPPVFSLGAAFHPENLLFPFAYYEQRGIEVTPTDRGGDVTFHGPNQLVAYPVFDLKPLGQDLHQWLRGLEEAVILGLAELGLVGVRFPPHTGVWVGGRKICAIGIKVRKWASKHGIARNCDNDLSPFDLIVPCGIRGYEVTSLSRELGRDVTMAEAVPALLRGFESVFEIDLAEQSREALLDRLEGKGWERGA
jgi:lipoyl(octanoyl) transferase